MKKRHKKLSAALERLRQNKGIRVGAAENTPAFNQFAMEAG